MKILAQPLLIRTGGGSAVRYSYFTATCSKARPVIPAMSETDMPFFFIALSYFPRSESVIFARFAFSDMRVNIRSPTFQKTRKNPTILRLRA